MMHDQKNLQVYLSQAGGRLAAVCSSDLPLEKYTYTLSRDGEALRREESSEEEILFTLDRPGNYVVSVEAYTKDGHALSADSTRLAYGVREGNNDRLRTGWLKPTGHVLRELRENLRRMFRVAQYDYRVVNKDSYLGRLWGLLNPLIQIGTFWFVFGVGIRSGRDVDGHPFLIWMLCGLLPWFLINTGMLTGASSIYAKANTVLRLHYPLATIPMGSVLVAFFDHVVMLIILFAVALIYGYTPDLYWLNLLYYMAYTIFFLTALSLITSTLTMIARDFLKLLQSLMRLLFYVTPILWTMEAMPAGYQMVMKASPILYIVNGYRDSLLYHRSFFDQPMETAGFLLFTAVLFIVGCHMHMKHRSQFLDML